MKNKVSIIMPVLNGEKYIREAIDSILAQTYKNCELVVVDDGSTDRTPEILRSYRDRLEVQYFRHHVQRGICLSVNDGLRNASGEFIAFLDHDDRWLPGFLETVVSYLNSHRDVGMVHTDFQTIDTQGEIIEESVARCRRKTRPSGYVFARLFQESFIVGDGTLIRKECFDRLGGWDETLHWGDYHMWLRIARHYQIDFIAAPLAQYRQHPSQSTRRVTAGDPDQSSVPLIAIRKILESYPEIWRELGERTVRRRQASLYFDSAYSCMWNGAAKNSRICLRKAVNLWPSNGRFYLLYLTSLFPSSVATAARDAWHKVLGDRQYEQLRSIARWEVSGKS